ncbi:MAG: secondary thiamine-phosphate synthase enzyme YjbQ [Candidatus Micrarchaeales archaeon]
MVKNKIFEINTKGNCDIIDITSTVEKIVEDSKVEEGLCVVCVKGSTIGITTIEYEEGLIQDFKEIFDKIIPKGDYKHNKAWGDENGHSHLRASILKSSIQIPIHEKKLWLGTWQQIVVVDFDTRPRRREVLVSILQ